MASSSPERITLLQDGESETSFSSPDKTGNKTDRTLLDLSLSVDVDKKTDDSAASKVVEGE